MTRISFRTVIAAAAITMTVHSTVAQLSTPPATPAELESVYTKAIEKRTDDILQELKLDDSTKTMKVRHAIIAQYRALRARDAVVDARLEAQGKDTSFENPERAALVQPITRLLHNAFVATLSAYLTPEQVEAVKDKMTYNKVEVTYSAYCNIIPNLTETDKARILESLKVAREEAMDGGSAQEKHAIFDKYKKDIDGYLDAHGHDVAKALKDWEAKQNVAEKSDEGSSNQKN